VYIWAVNHDHLVESSLGYFMNPLIVVVLGVVVLGERMRRLQWVAVGIATLAVVVLTVDYGRPPWIALVLAGSFSLYGLLKKQATVGPLESLGVETAALLLPAVGYVAYLSMQGTASFGRASVGQHALLIGAGVFTAVPLVMFGAAAHRIPLVTLGLLQYLNPTMQFGLGVFLRHEPFPASRLAGFVLVWTALVIFVVDGLRGASPTLTGEVTGDDADPSHPVDPRSDHEQDARNAHPVEPEPNPV
jgi:chloramphenicol-sensitive protein RarD